MRPTPIVPWWVLTSMLLLTALPQLSCRNPAELRWAVQRGTIASNGMEPMVTLPTQVVAGQEATVTVYTFGGGCVKLAYTNSRVSGDTAVVEPFDSVVVQLPANMACTTELELLPHSASVIMSRSGPGTIRIVGWNDVAHADTTLVYTVSVQ